MLKTIIISPTKYLEEALRSCNLQNFIIESSTEESSEKDVIVVRDHFDRYSACFQGEEIFFTKPIKLSELVNLLLRFYGTYFINLGDVIFIPSENIMKNYSGAKVVLTDRESKIISSLITAEGKYQTQAEISAKVFGYNQEVDSNSLESHIYRLRQKLLQITQKSLIVTETEGYKLELR